MELELSEWEGSKLPANNVVWLTGARRSDYTMELDITENGALNSNPLILGVLFCSS